MSQSGESGATTYAAVTVILLLAVGALALFKYNLFGVNDMLSTSSDERTNIPTREPLAGGDGGPTTNPDPTGPGPKPSDDKYRTRPKSSCGLCPRAGS
jgi:hypothetical protein